eukprot:6027810-Amphidinium_carterae.1
MAGQTPELDLATEQTPELASLPVNVRTMLLKHGAQTFGSSQLTVDQAKLLAESKGFTKFSGDVSAVTSATAFEDGYGATQALAEALHAND